MFHNRSGHIKEGIGWSTWDTTTCMPFWPIQQVCVKEVIVFNDQTLSGEDTYVILNRFDLVCIPPTNQTISTTQAPTTTALHSTCPVQQVLIGGVLAQCDTNTGTLYTNISVDLRNQTELLNISGVSIQVNGSVFLGGGLQVDNNTRINTTGLAPVCTKFCS